MVAISLPNFQAVRHSAVTIEITQPTPRNIGLMNAHNTNPMIEPIRTAIHFATFFMRLRLEMDALPRLTDMLLFVFIVRHFFLCVYRLSKFCLLVESLACGGNKGLFAFG